MPEDKGKKTSARNWRVTARLVAISPWAYLVLLLLAFRDPPGILIVPIIFPVIIAIVLTGVYAKKLNRSYGWVIAGLFTDGLALFILSYLRSKNPNELEERLGEEMAEHVKYLKNWAVWGLIWGLLNTGLVLFLQDGIRKGKLEASISMMLLSVLLVLSVIVVIAAITCMALRTPWPGFFAVFSVYWIFVGIVNIASGKSYYIFIGLCALALGLSSINRGTKYSALKRDKDNIGLDI